jgi:hypothetical protein
MPVAFVPRALARVQGCGPQHGFWGRLCTNIDVLAILVAASVSQDASDQARAVKSPIQGSVSHKRSSIRFLGLWTETTDAYDDECAALLCNLHRKILLSQGGGNVAHVSSNRILLPEIDTDLSTLIRRITENTRNRFMWRLRLSLQDAS